MSDRLHGILLKLDRAEEHFHAVQDAVLPSTYCKCKITREKNLETGLFDLRLFLVEPNRTLSTYIGDCLHNLRCALDYLVYQLVLAANNKPSGSNMFPVAKNI